MAPRIDEDAVLLALFKRLLTSGGTPSVHLGDHWLLIDGTDWDITDSEQAALEGLVRRHRPGVRPPQPLKDPGDA